MPPPTPQPPTPPATTSPPTTGPISLREAARRLGVHYMTAYRYVRTGRLPARRDGQEWLIDPDDLSLLRDQPPPSPGQRAQADRVPILMARMTAGDEAGAWRIVDDALASGMDATGIYLDLLVPALRAVGAAWADGMISIAGEHRASAVAQRLIGRLGPQFARRGRKRGTVVTGGPAGEQHGLPGAIISDLLRGQGFEVIDLGANTPAASFAETAREASRLVAVVIGVTAPGLDDNVRSVVAALADASLTAPVLVGGAAITGAAHARELGANAWTGPDGRAVLAAVDQAAVARTSVDSGAVNAVRPGE
ncbi:MAG TPA: B12-binding domain-containing protein [Streptosporangiaceae bacterium]